VIAAWNRGGGACVICHELSQQLAREVTMRTNMYSETHTEMGRKVETAVEARAGFLDHPVLVVLVVSTALVTLLFGLVGFGIVGGGG
jgi:hypothetical protein